MSGDWHFLVALNEKLRALRDPVEIQNVAVHLIGEHLQATRVHYALIQGDEFVISRSYADQAAAAFPDHGPVARFGKAVTDACLRNEAVAVEDAGTDPRFTDVERTQFLSTGITAFLAVPLTKGGRWLALFGVHAPTPRRWTDDQIALAEVIAERTWGAGERARTDEALNRQTSLEADLRANEERLAFLLHLNDALRPLSDPGEVQDVAARFLGQHLAANRVSYAEIRGGTYTIRREYTSGVPSRTEEGREITVSGELVEALRRGESVVVNDVETEPRMTDANRTTLQSRNVEAF